MKLKELKCPNCGYSLEEKDLDQRLLMARCSHCRSVFGLENIFQIDKMPFERRLKAPMPPSFQVENKNGVCTISYKWFKLLHVFLICFTVVWNAFMVVWHTMAISSGAWFMSVFGLIHTAVGVGLAYYTLAGMLNRTTISASRNKLSIRHKPIPWFGAKDYDRFEITQLYGKEKQHRNQNSTTTSYSLHALTKNGNTIKLLSMLDSQEAVLFLEQELEKALGITDRPVEGEIPRTP